MTQPGRGPTTAGVTDRDAHSTGPARLLALTAAGIAVLFYLIGFLGDVGITTGDVGILLIGGGLLVGASVLPQVGRVLLPGAVAVVVGMLVLLQIVASGGSSGLLVGALVLAFLEALAAVAAFLMDIGLITPPVPRTAPPAYGQPPTQQWTAGQPAPGAGAWPGGTAPGWPGPGPTAWPPGGPPAPGQVGPPAPGAPAYGQPPVYHPSAAGPPGSWLPTAGPAGDPSATAAYERPAGGPGSSAHPSEATAVFALPPSGARGVAPGSTEAVAGSAPAVAWSGAGHETPPGWGQHEASQTVGAGATDPVTSPAAGRDTAPIGTPATPAWGQPAVAMADPASSPTAGRSAGEGPDSRYEQDAERTDIAAAPAPVEREEN